MINLSRTIALFVVFASLFSAPRISHGMSYPSEQADAIWLDKQNCLVANNENNNGVCWVNTTERFSGNPEYTSITGLVMLNGTETIREYLVQDVQTRKENLAGKYLLTISFTRPGPNNHSNNPYLYTQAIRDDVYIIDYFTPQERNLTPSWKVNYTLEPLENTDSIDTFKLSYLQSSSNSTTEQGVGYFWRTGMFIVDSEAAGNAIIKEYAAATKVTNLTIRKNDSSETTVQWNTIPHQERYKIEVTGLFKGKQKRYTYTTTSEQFFVDLNRTIAGNRYRVRVKALFGNGIYTQWSNPLKITAKRSD